MPEVKQKMIHKTFEIKAIQKGLDPNAPLTISGIANAANPDRVREVVVKEAWSLENYKKNPIILFNHDYHQPVGICTGIEATDEGLLCTATIGNPESGYPLTDVQMMVRSLLAQGIIKAFSVGFIPDQMQYDDEKDLVTINKAELLEISLVSVPCQQESLINEVKAFSRKEKVAMDEQMVARFDTIDNSIKACQEKINACYDILNKNGEPTETPTVEESVRAEISTLKTENEELKTIISEYKKLV